MYDDGEGAAHDFCIVCFQRKAEYVDVAGYMVMGNVDTQHINSFGYCQTHLDGMVNEFNRGCLSLLYFENNTREHEHADEVLVKRGYCDAYFL